MQMEPKVSVFIDICRTSIRESIIAQFWINSNRNVIEANLINLCFEDELQK
jgi:hypothetical protein